VCSTHGAEFRLEDGLCTSGPCLGERLQQVMIEIKDGCILVAEGAGL
jgi:nitrite reductase/ring-hydroxylating ferredoxin subunit